jgi:hypothetical protein
MMPWATSVGFICSALTCLEEVNFIVDNIERIGKLGLDKVQGRSQKEMAASYLVLLCCFIEETLMNIYK